MSALFERYRPRRWEEVIGQDKAVGTLRRLAERGQLGGRAYWIAGKSGTGKTSIARLIAEEVANEFLIREIDATSLTVAQLHELERESNHKGWGDKPGRAYIVNEAHGLRRDVIRSLLVTLDTEKIPPHVVWIFTTTTEGEKSLFEDYDDASPLLSRCFPVPWTQRGWNESVAKRVQEIARAEGLDGKPYSVYLKAANEARGNFRALLQAVEAGQFGS